MGKFQGKYLFMVFAENLINSLEENDCLREFLKYFPNCAKIMDITIFNAWFKFSQYLGLCQKLEKMVADISFPAVY